MSKSAPKNVIGPRLIADLRRLGLDSPEKIKNATSLNGHSIWRYNEGDRSPSVARLQEVAGKVEKLDLHWIITGSPAPLPGSCSSFNMPIISRTATDLSISDNWCRTWLESINLKPDQGAILIVEEDSWQPLINPGDMIIFDTQNKDLAYAGQFVLRWHDAPVMRRVEPAGQGKFILSSAQLSNGLTVNADEIEPLGRLMGVLHGRS